VTFFKLGSKDSFFKNKQHCMHLKKLASLFASEKQVGVLGLKNKHQIKTFLFVKLCPFFKITASILLISNS